jgi:hypothetical protein
MQKNIFAAYFVMLLFPSIHTVAQKQDFSEDLYYDQSVILELGTSIGAMNCLTDLGGGRGSGKSFLKDINFSNFRPSSSIYISVAYKNAVTIRTDATWGIVTAKDNVLKNVAASTLGRYDRNLSFRSTIFELMLAAEVHPRYFKKYTHNQNLPRISPYFMLGIGYFVFNPVAKFEGKWVELRPLRTEGQGFPEYPNRKVYKLNQINFPVGGGIRYKLTPVINVSAELVYRILNTDYLDDVSTQFIPAKLFQKHLAPGLSDMALKLNDRKWELNPNAATITDDIRGNPNKNDAYFGFNFKVGILF